MAGLLDLQTEEERAAAQRALMAYANQVSPQQSAPQFMEPGLRPYDPSIRDRAASYLMGDRPSQPRMNFVEGLLGSRGAGTTGISLADFTPAGIVFGGNEARRDFENDQYLSGALNAMAVMPGARVVTEPLKRAAAQAAVKAAPEAAQAAARAVPEAVELSGAFGQGLAPVRGETSKELVKMQKQQLTPQQLETLDRLKQSNPEIARATKFLIPDELGVLLDSRTGLENFSRVLDVLPTASEMTSLAKAGAPKQGWYRGSTQALVDVFGVEDAPRFAALLAATSPQTSVESNLTNTLNIWKNWTAAGRPTDERSIKAIMGQSVQGTKGEDSILGAWLPNTMRALQAEDPLKTVISGPKVDSFFRNLADDVYRFTNDAWMANATGINQDILRQSPSAKQLASGNPGFSPAYSALSARGREGAQRANMLPYEGQETIWSYVMPLMEGQSRFGMPARALLDKNMITPDVVRGTPDFSTLLQQPAYRGILEQAGYGDQLTAMKPFEFPRNLPELTAGDMRNIDKTAMRLEDLRGLRDREKRAMAQGFKPGERTTAFANAEAIPGLGTGHLENLIDAPMGTRQHFTGKISNAFQDQQGIDILHKNLGLNPITTRPVTGAFMNPAGKLEIQPGWSMGAELPVKMGPNGPRLDPYDEQKLRAAATFRGGVTAQLGSPFNAQYADEAGKNLVIARDKKVTPEEMGGLLGRYGADRISPVDTGGSVNLLNWGDRFTKEEADEIGGLLGSKKVASTRELTDPDMNYVNLEKEFKAGVGSRQVTGRMIDELNKLTPKDFKRLDNSEIRQVAGDILSTYEQQAKKKGAQVRPDLMNMLRVVKDGGLAGLRKALDDPEQLLPVLAAIGLAPVLLQASDRKSSGEGY